jgi:hypothetical protein
MLSWVLYSFAVWMIGQTLYELFSGNIVFFLGSFNVTREENPGSYWFCFLTTAAMTVFVCYLAYDLAVSSH